MGRIILYFQLIFSVAIGIFFLHCAAQAPPQGGPKDESGPELVHITPENKSTNITPSSIVFHFDEYLDWKTVADNIDISPISIPMGVICKGKNIEIEFPDPLPENTTILLSLRTNIKDKRKNPLSSPIVYAFSTGTVLDSGMVSGNILMPEKKACSLALQKLENDSLIVEYQLPTLTREQYQFEHIKPGEYFITASFSNNKNIDFISPISITNNVKENFVDIAMLTPNRIQHFPTQKPQLLEILPNDSTVISPFENIQIRCTGNLPDFPIDSVTITCNQSVVTSQWGICGNRWIFHSKPWTPNSEISVRYDTLEVRFFVLPEDSLGGITSTFLCDDSPNWKIIIVENGTLKPIATIPIEDNHDWNIDNIPPAIYRIIAFKDINNNGKFDTALGEVFNTAEPFWIYPEPIKTRARWIIEVEQ